MNAEIIAEVKRMSPFGWESPYPWTTLFDMADKIGNMIAIHTDERWGGRMDDVAIAKRLTTKDIVAKGIHDDDDHIRLALTYGASWVWVVGRIPHDSLLRFCILEPTHLAAIKDYPKDSRVVWNQRDIIHGGDKTETFEEARSLWDGWLCQASFIDSPEDVHERADAVIVGERLPRFKMALLGNEVETQRSNDDERSNRENNEEADRMVI